MNHRRASRAAAAIDVEDAAYAAVGITADAQARGGRRVLHPRGDVDREAADRALLIDAAAQQQAPVWRTGRRSRRGPAPPDFLTPWASSAAIMVRSRSLSVDMGREDT
jgi:hypothetical protein